MKEKLTDIFWFSCGCISLGVLVGSIIFLLSLSVAKAQTPPTINDVQWTASRYAFVYSVPREDLLAVLRCESYYGKYNLGDNGHSRGPVQISDIHHPEVTDEQAYDMDFSIRFLARKISEGHGNEWTCYRKLAFDK